MDPHTCVFDNGSYMTKAGFSDQDSPRACFPSVVGVPKNVIIGGGGSLNNITTFVGDEAMSRRVPPQFRYPIRKGIVMDWNDMERVWAHTFDNELRINSEECRIMLSESPLNTRVNREMMTQIMFESFEVLAMVGVIQSVLAMYACGKSTGLGLDSGDGISHTVPVYEGYALTSGISTMNMGGHELTDLLMKHLMELGHTFSTSAEREIVRDIKEKLCYVALDFESQMKKAAETSQIDAFYELPDGNIITISKECFKCTETLFQPQILGMEHCSFQEMTFNSIRKCDLDIRKELFSNIVLSGGSTMFQGFSERLEKELKEMIPSSVNININAPTFRKYSVWIGGSILSSFSTFESMWITKKDYAEVGSSIVHRKCF